MRKLVRIDYLAKKIIKEMAYYILELDNVFFLLLCFFSSAWEEKHKGGG